MANEAVIQTLLGDRGDVVSYTVADGTAIEKGTLCVLYDPRVVSGATAINAAGIVAGIASSEKVASDGSTTLGLYTNGIFDLTCNAGIAVTLGARVSLSGGNTIKNATEAEIALGQDFGRALETGSTSEVIMVKVSC